MASCLEQWANSGETALDMEDEEKVTQTLHGRVKWFDPGKGFGFIVGDEGGSDILLHANVLRNYGQNSVADGAGISVKVQMTQRGVQAVEVLDIEPPVGGSFPLMDENAPSTPEDIAALPLEPARVKWFDKGKGFGFANVFGRPEDVFIHIEVLRVSGFADLQAGEAVCLRIIEGKRGRMAMQVASWEAAVRHQAG
jgi:cold shock protein